KRGRRGESKRLEEEGPEHRDGSGGHSFGQSITPARHAENPRRALRRDADVSREALRGDGAGDQGGQRHVVQPAQGRPEDQDPCLTVGLARVEGRTPANTRSAYPFEGSPPDVAMESTRVGPRLYATSASSRSPSKRRSRSRR